MRLLMNHIPDQDEHLVRYYGYYSNRSRGARQKAEQEDGIPLSIIKLTVINSPDNGQKWRDN